MVIVYVLCGIPSSGKSTIAKEICSEYKYNLYSFDSLSKGYKFEERQKVYNKMYADIATDIVNECGIVYDNLNITYDRRLELLHALKDIPCKKILIVMTTPLEECVRRNSQRQGQARLPDFVIYHLNQKYQLPSLEEGWDDIQYI